MCRKRTRILILFNVYNIDRFTAPSNTLWQRRSTCLLLKDVRCILPNIEFQIYRKRDTPVVYLCSVGAGHRELPFFTRKLYTRRFFWLCIQYTWKNFALYVLFCTPLVRMSRAEHKFLYIFSCLYSIYMLFIHPAIIIVLCG